MTSTRVESDPGLRLRQSDRRVINAIGKTMTVLSALAEEVAPLGVSEIARKTNIPKSTTFRILSTLVELRLVDHHDRRYQLGYRLGLFAHKFVLSHRQLHQILLPHLLDLYEETHGVVKLAVLNGAEVTYLNKLHGHRHVRTPSYNTLSAPAYCTAAGKALLAFAAHDAASGFADERMVSWTPVTITNGTALRAELTRIREVGLAFDRQEYAPGVLCVAAPVFDLNRVPVAAISVAGLAGRLCLDQVGSSVRRVASRASQAVRQRDRFTDVVPQYG
jgi:IclR family transcriptional regulator, KDG regulon repressor